MSKEKINSIKKQIIELIKQKGFPVGYVVDDADSYTGYFVRKSDDIVPLGYASSGTENTLTLEDLSLIDLSTLLEYGTRKGDKDWKGLLEMVEQEKESKENGEVDNE